MLTSSVWRGPATRMFCTGLVAGGATTAFGAMVAGSLLRPAVPPAARGWLLVVAAVVAVGAELGLYRLRVPQNRRQVPIWIIREGNRTGAFQFGYELGTGVRTLVPSALPHVALLAVALLATWWQALAAGAAFGLGRAAMTLARQVAPVPDRWDTQLTATLRPSRALLALATLPAVAAICGLR